MVGQSFLLFFKMNKTIACLNNHICLFWVFQYEYTFGIVTQNTPLFKHKNTFVHHQQFLWVCTYITFVEAIKWSIYKMNVLTIRAPWWQFEVMNTQTFWLIYNLNSEKAISQKCQNTFQIQSISRSIQKSIVIIA